MGGTAGVRRAARRLMVAVAVLLAVHGGLLPMRADPPPIRAEQLDGVWFWSGTVTSVASTIPDVDVPAGTLGYDLDFVGGGSAPDPLFHYGANIGCVKAGGSVEIIQGYDNRRTFVESWSQSSTLDSTCLKIRIGHVVDGGPPGATGQMKVRFSFWRPDPPGGLYPNRVSIRFGGPVVEVDVPPLYTIATPAVVVDTGDGDGTWFAFSCIAPTNSSIGNVPGPALVPGQGWAIQVSIPSGCQRLRMSGASTGVSNPFARSDKIVTWMSLSGPGQPLLGPTPPSLLDEQWEIGTDLLDPNAATGATSDPVHTFTGALVHRQVDLAIPGQGPSPALVRSYASIDSRVGPLGPGWTHNYAIRLTRDPADGKTVLVGPRGRSDKYAPPGGVSMAVGTYTPPPHVQTTLTRTLDYAYRAQHKDGSAWLFDGTGRLTSMLDRYGNRSDLTYNGSGQLATVSDPAGRGALTFTYYTAGGPAQGRLWKVTDWSNRVVEYGYDGSGRLSTVKDREGKVTTHTYDGTSHRLVSIIDANGHVAVTNVYDAQGRVREQWDALAGSSPSADQKTQITYDDDDGSSLVGATTIKLPLASFDPANPGWRPVEVHRYDAQGRITSKTTKPTSDTSEHATQTYSWDGNRNLTSFTSGRGTTTTYCYDMATSGVTIPGARGNLTRVIVPPPTGSTPLVTLYEYDAKNNVTRMVPPRGVNAPPGTTCAADLTAAVDNVYATSYAYAASGALLTSVTRRYLEGGAERQLITTIEYDPSLPGQPLIVRASRFGGCPVANPCLTGVRTTLDYYRTSVAGEGSRAGLVKSVTNALGQTSAFDYDAVGRLVKRTDPLGGAWESTFDQEDRVLTTLTPSVSGQGRLTTTYRYDAVGNLLSVKDARGQFTTYAYDARDSLSEIKESPDPWTVEASPPASTITTTYSYDRLANLQRVTRAKNTPDERVTTYGYDGLNRPRIEIQDDTPGGLKLPTTWHYDKNNALDSYKDAKLQTTTVTRDILNRVTQVAYPGVTAISYQYDRDGRRTTMVDGTGQADYAYDALGRLTSVSKGGQSVAYAYDYDSNVKSVSYPLLSGEAARVVTYSYDTARRLTGSGDWAGRATSYSYAADGLLATATLPNGTQTRYAYDAARRLTEVCHVQPGAGACPNPSVIGRHQYTLDQVGNRVGLTELLAPVNTFPPNPVQPSGEPAARPSGRGGTVNAGPTPVPVPGHHAAVAPSGAPQGMPAARPDPPIDTLVTYSYQHDRLNRLTTVLRGQQNPSVTNVYAYDRVGNRIGASGGGEAYGYGYDRADRLVAINGFVRTADENGNQLTTHGGTYAYDGANRLISATVGGATTSYVYDGDGKRVSQTTGGVTTSYRYDENRGLPVLLDDGTRRYVWGAHGLAYAVEKTTNPNPFVDVYHADGVGTVRALTDGTTTAPAPAKVTQRTDTNPFGVVTGNAGSKTQPFGFTGEQRDANGLINLRARVYDPSVGRFLQRDPFGGMIASPLSLNRFSYVANNPLKLVDPSGLTPSKVIQDNTTSTGDKCLSYHNPLHGEITGGSTVNVLECTDLGTITTADVQVCTGVGLGGPATCLTVTIEVPHAAAANPGGGGASQKYQNHHIATDKHHTLFTPILEALFWLAGMSLKDPANQVKLPSPPHIGPHSFNYNAEVLRDVFLAVVGKSQQAARQGLLATLDMWRAKLIANPSLVKK
ncbi:MAG: RHS repeat-associated core domain-containing protein [Chloroflexota bacterium]